MTNESELSEREREIICLVATGASNKEIAQRLFISTNTVKVHLRNIFAKIGVTSRTEATLFAIREGLVPTPGNLPPQAVIAGEVTGSPLGENGARVRPPQRRARMIALLSVAALVFLAMVGVTIRQLVAPLQPAAPQTPAPRWQERAPLPSPRSGLAAALYDGKVYAIGGTGPGGVAADTYQYDPNSNQWNSLAAKPTAITEASAAVIGEMILIPGGTLTDGQPTDIFEAYDPRRDRWEKKSSLPVKISRYGLSTYEGKLYLFGGWDGKKVLSSVYVYDPAVDAWSTKSSMPTARQFPGAAVSGERIYVGGGSDGIRPLTVNEVYFPGRDRNGESPWVRGTRLPEGRSGMGATFIADSMYLLGGSVAGNRADSLRYLPASESWDRLESPLLDGLSRFGMVQAGDYVYILGGQTASQELKDTTLRYQALYTINLPVLSH